jgi:hypothetical protein
MKLQATLSGIAACGVIATTLLAQDSVSKIQGLPGDAVLAHLTNEQVNDFVVDQSALHSSWGAVFGVAPIIKASAQKANNPSFFTQNHSAQGMSRLTKSSVPFVRSSYSVWHGQGFGVNDNSLLDNPGTPVNTSTFTGFQLGVAFAEFGTGDTNPAGSNASLNNIISGIVNFTDARPSRLYVSRIVAGTNGLSDGCNSASFGFGQIDEDGSVHFRADGYNAVDCGGVTAFTGDNYFRVRALSRNSTAVNVLSNTGGADAGATDWLLMDSPTTHNTPNGIPKSIAGRPILIGSNFLTQYVYEQVAGSTTATGSHLAPGMIDHRGSVAYSQFNFPTLLGASTTGTAGILARTTPSYTDSINVWGLSGNGSVTGTLARTLPASITDPAQPAWSSSILPGISELDHYHSQTAFDGGNSQVAIGEDKNGNMLLAATAYYGFNPPPSYPYTNPCNYIAVARIDPSGNTAWSVAGWTEQTASVSDGKTIFQNGTTAIGRMTGANGSGAPNGPAISAPMFDSVGNVWFLAQVQLDGPPSTVKNALLRAVYDAATFSYKLELVFKEGDVFQGQNSNTPYIIEYMDIRDSDSVASSTAWSSNISAGAFKNRSVTNLQPTDSATLGGLVIGAHIIYDVNGDGQFIRSTGTNGVPGSPDEDYQTLLYVSASADCNNNGIPDDADIANGTSMDANGDGIPDECQNAGHDFCIPGVNGVRSCPCNNPQVPAGSDRGCNNSASTGGAALTSSGTASLSNDTVTFTSTGEKPTAFSIFLQGNSVISAGVTFGQGVRCAGGSLKRLYIHSASGGVVSGGFGVGSDQPVHVRSAALGDTIPPGGVREYQVYYRDPTILGGCPSLSTFNSSQGQQVTWNP